MCAGPLAVVMNRELAIDPALIDRTHGRDQSVERAEEVNQVGYIIGHAYSGRGTAPLAVAAGIESDASPMRRERMICFYGDQCGT